MLEVFCGQGRSIVVQRLKKKQKRRTKSESNSFHEKKVDSLYTSTIVCFRDLLSCTESKANKEVPPPLSLEERWDEASSQLAVVMQSAAIPEMIPFDATLDTPIDEQK